MNLMNGMKDLHHQAMQLAVGEPSASHRRGTGSQCSLARGARAGTAGRGVGRPDLALEPTRSVLHHSAGTLACQCGEYCVASTLTTTACHVSPPTKMSPRS